MHLSTNLIGLLGIHVDGGPTTTLQCSYGQEGCKAADQLCRERDACFRVTVQLPSVLEAKKRYRQNP